MQWAPGAREACIESDDALDALLAALIARAAALGLTVPPGADDLELARREGWIHLPQKDSLAALLAGAEDDAEMDLAGSSSLPVWA